MTMHLRMIAALAFASLVVMTGPTQPLRAQGDANTIVPPIAFKDLRWRSVGATRGGRVTAYSGVRQQPFTFYFGGVGGGIWKTEDAGINWAPISDGQMATGSIGSIDVAPSNPNHVWVGTGSAAIRSNVIIGRGVYKSLDAGKTWQFMGLKESGQI
ncbi:MAG: WD40/YVTN/BNR-like repeat-containing protein, partial [Vicinamibacterales bacterium]